jgi:hypothetical protein
MNGECHPILGRRDHAESRKFVCGDSADGLGLPSGADQARRLGAHIVEYIDAHGDANAAAALYAELSRLSDAELERRGIPHRDLHRCVLEILIGR